MKNLYLLILCILCMSASMAQRAPVAVNDAATVAETGTVLINVLANDSNFNTGDTVCLTSVWGNPSGWATVQSCTKVLFHPLNPTFVGLDTFFYRSCDNQRPTLCDTGRVIVNVLIRAPKALNDSLTLIQNTAVTLNVLANDSNFNPQDSIRITNIWGMPTGWATIPDSTHVTVHPSSINYYGMLNIYYRSCDWRIPTLCDTGKIVVNVIRTPRAYPDVATMHQPDTAFINVIANDSILNVRDSACITNIWGLPAGWAAAYSCNTIAYTPYITFSGIDTFYYSSCYTQTATLCDTSMVIVNVILSKPLVDFVWIEDSPCVAEVFNNALLADSVHWTVQYLTGNGTNQTLGNMNQFYLTANQADSGFQAEVCQTGYNTTGDSTVCYTFWIQCTINTGITSLTASHLRVYPAPASDRIQIDMSGIDRAALNNASSIVIYDMIGKELKAISIDELAGSISVSDLSPGIYLIGLVDKGQSRKLLSKFEIMR